MNLSAEYLHDLDRETEKLIKQYEWARSVSDRDTAGDYQIKLGTIRKCRALFLKRCQELGISIEGDRPETRTTDLYPGKETPPVPLPPNPEKDISDPEHLKIIRANFSCGKLVRFPRGLNRKKIILGVIVRMFDPAKTYPESEVNDIIRIVHNDYCTIRRYLVDLDFMARDAGIYRIRHQS